MKSDAVYFDDILQSINAIGIHTQGLTRGQFDTNITAQDAVIRRIAIIGEAVSKLSEETKASHQNIPWRDIVGMRNILVHKYDGVEMDFVWDVVQERLPELRLVIESMLNENDIKKLA